MGRFLNKKIDLEHKNGNCLTRLPFFFYICIMKEVLYRKEIRKYYNVEYRNYNPIDELEKQIIDYSFSNHTDFKKHPIYQPISTSQTQECFLENYGNPLYHISEQIHLIVVEKYGDKISLKLFVNNRQRNVGKLWFKINKSMRYVTVNTKTGDVYNGSIMNYHLKRKYRKKIRRNCFYNPILNQMKYDINSAIGGITISESEIREKKDIVNEILTIFTSQFSKHSDLEYLSFDDRLFKFYLDKRNVKIPNNFYTFKGEWFGKEIKKILKKNGNRMIDAIMERHNLSGKKIKSALHLCEDFNLELYKKAKKFFGDDWINQDSQFILACLNSKYYFNDIPEEFFTYTTKEELRRFFNLFKTMVINHVINPHTLYDHVSFYIQLKRFGEVELKWLSENDMEFRDEHIEWTNKIEHYRNGSYDRIYPEYSYDIIEKLITIGDNIYYSKLLDNSSNYNEESILQSNCVKTYIAKSDSIIVSLRKQNIDSNERATIEYRIKNTLDGIKIGRVQSLGRFNGLLDKEWNEVLLKLDKIMLSYIEDKRFETVQIKKTCNNGVVIETTSDWDEMGNLTWENNYI